jgi:hypothetical protein
MGPAEMLALVSTDQPGVARFRHRVALMTACHHGTPAPVTGALPLESFRCFLRSRPPRLAIANRSADWGHEAGMSHRIQFAERKPPATKF